MRHLSFKHPFYLLLAVIFLAIQTFAAGVVDTTFGTNGTATVDVGAPVTLTKVLMQPDSKIIAGGIISGSSTGSDIFLIKLNSNGTLDQSFGTGGKVITTLSNGDDVINDIHLQADGKILAVGYTPAPSGNSPQDFLLMRYNSNGMLDNSFGTNGLVIINQEVYDTLNAVTVQTDGKIVAVGSFSDGTEASRRTAVFRFQSNGTRDFNFASNGAIYMPRPTLQLGDFVSGPVDTAVLGNGKILVGYSFAVNRPGSSGDCTGTIFQTVENDGSSFVTSTGAGRCGSGYGFSAGRVAFDVLPNGTLATANSGVVTSGSKQFFATGSELAVMPNGKFLVANGKFGIIKLFSEKAFVGRIARVPNVSVALKVAGLSENNFVAAFGSTSQLTVIKYRSVSSQATRLADFDLDEKTDFWVYRSSNRNIYNLLTTGDGATQVAQTQLPNAAIKIVPEYNEFLNGGNGSFWTNFITYMDTESRYWETRFHDPNLSVLVLPTQPGDMAVGGDFDGDFFNDATFFRPSNGTWYTRSFAGIFSATLQWGTLGDKPVPADYDYDGVTDYAVYRPSNGTWYIRKSSDNSAIVFQWGISSDIPLTGDFDADGKADFTVYRASEGKWYQYLTTEGVKITQFGLATDSPVPGDYDGDGRHDIAIYRNGNWWMLQSRDGLKVVQWGTTGDIPVSVRYDN